MIVTQMVMIAPKEMSIMFFLSVLVSLVYHTIKYLSSRKSLARWKVYATRVLFQLSFPLPLDTNSIPRYVLFVNTFFEKSRKNFLDVIRLNPAGQKEGCYSHPSSTSLNIIERKSIFTSSYKPSKIWNTFCLVSKSGIIPKSISLTTEQTKIHSSFSSIMQPIKSAFSFKLFRSLVNRSMLHICSFLSVYVQVVEGIAPLYIIQQP